jgi:hypothetical protein
VATRLGLHVTAEELAIWQARRTDNSTTQNGTTFQSIYTNRIKNKADTFKATPSSDGLWNPTWAAYPPTKSCFPEGQQTNKPGLTNGLNMMASAFVFMLTGDTTYASPVLSNLLTQAGRASTNWADTALWCVNNDDTISIELPGWITRLLFAYDYLRAGGYTISSGDRITIETWFNNAAIYWLARQDLQIHDNVFPGRLTDDYTCSNNCPGSAIGITYFGGNTVNWFHNAWSNRIANDLTLVAAVANIKDPSITLNANLGPRSKRFFTEAIEYAFFPNGACHEIYRWSDGGTHDEMIGSAWTHANFLLGPLISCADHFGRAGDLSLLTLNTATGSFGTGGTLKSLLTPMQEMARMQNGTVSRYASTVTTSDATLLINGNSESGHSEDWAGMLANMYYKDSEVDTAMNRTLTPGSS